METSNLKDMSEPSRRATKPVMRVCFRSKRIFLSRLTIKLLGNPSHLSFWYDETSRKLIISPADRDDLDAYEIPRFYWNDSSRSCEISRIAFLKALQYRIGWKDGNRYIYNGFLIRSGDVPAAVFDLRFFESTIS